MLFLYFSFKTSFLLSFKKIYWYHDLNGGVCVWYLNVLEHEGVIAYLPQLHDSVHQGLRATFTL